MSNFLIIPKIDSIEESLSLAREYGFGFEFNDFFHPSVLDDKERIEQITAEYKAHGLPEYCTCHGDFFDVTVFSEDRLIKEISEMRVRQSIEAALGIGAKAVVFHTNHNPFFVSSGYVNNWINANVSLWGRMLEEYPGIDIYIENMCDSSPDMLASLAKEMKSYSRFGVCFDYAHATVFGGNEIDRWVTALAPYIKHLHINDNDLKYDLHLAVGDGQIDWNIFKDYYLEYFTDKTILIETGDLNNQRRSAEFLGKLGIL